MRQTVGELKKHLHSGRWYVRIKGRKPPNKYIGTKDTSREEAEEIRRQLIADTIIATNTTQANDNEMSISQLVNYYLDNAVLKDGSKNKMDRVRYCKTFADKFSTMKVRDVKPFMVEKWINDQTEWNVTTKGNAIKHLAACFNWLLKQDCIGRSPIRAVKRPTPLIRGKEWVITQDEYNRLLPTVKTTYREVVECCWHTGCRPSEVLGASKDEYDPVHHTLTKISHKTMDKGKRRIIVLNDRADAIISNRASQVPSGLLFRSDNGNRIGVDVFMQYMRGRFDAIGIVHPVCNYSFRHSFATRCLKGEVSLEKTASFLGNTVKVCEKHYAHLLETVAENRHLLPQ